MGCTDSSESHLGGRVKVNVMSTFWGNLNWRWNAFTASGKLGSLITQSSVAWQKFQRLKAFGLLVFFKTFYFEKKIQNYRKLVIIIPWTSIYHSLDSSIATILQYLFYLFLPIYYTPSPSNEKGRKKKRFFLNHLSISAGRIPEYGPRIPLQNSIFNTHFDRRIILSWRQLRTSRLFTSFCPKIYKENFHL